MNVHLDWPSCRCSDCEAYRINVSHEKEMSDVALSEENDWLLDENKRLRAALKEISELGDVRADEAAFIATRALALNDGQSTEK